MFELIETHSLSRPRGQRTCSLPAMNFSNIGWCRTQLPRSARPRQSLITASMMAAAHVQTSATIKTAPTNANWAEVPQIPSGIACDGQTYGDHAGLCRRIHRALKRAQHGPAMSSPIRMTRCPSRVSFAALTSEMTTLNLQRYSEDQPQGVTSSRA
jgi:hypothetical protein